jgi:PiT family inorganic phosphate transporter
MHRSHRVAGALVGSGLSEGHRRIRWRLVLHIGAAWVVTLPAALLLAGSFAFAVEALT